MHNKPQNGEYLSELSPCKYSKFENWQIQEKFELKYVLMSFNLHQNLEI